MCFGHQSRTKGKEHWLYKVLSRNQNLTWVWKIKYGLENKNKFTYKI